MKITDYEIKIIELLCKETLSNSILQKVLKTPEKIDCNFTGVGYFLNIRHKELPSNKIICDKPSILAKYQDIELGFIAFIEKQKICLECYSYDSKVPSTIREGKVTYSAT